MPQAPSTRWCPTPEQLMILEEMYRSGIRTPNASQIQQITAHLSYYGKIEGKNVFYWFQNHKARDRQKLRRRLSRHHQLLHHHPINPQHPNLHHLEQPSPPPPPPLQQPLPHFLHQGGFQEATQEMNLVRKLEMSSKQEEQVTSGRTYWHEWMVMMGLGSALPTSCCRPIKTLDLFPIKSNTGLKDENNTSKSSSCSTSTD